MWTEAFDAELRGVSADAVDEQDRKIDRATLRLEMDIDSELAYGLPGGEEAVSNVEDGNWSVVRLPADTRTYQLQVLDEQGKVLREIVDLKRCKAEIVRKELKSGNRTLCRFSLEWPWREGQLEWAVKQLRTVLRLKLALQQTELAVA